METIKVFIETGQKKTFAGALDWPGWCRSGRDEAAALQALAAYGPRYAQALHGLGLAFQAPADASAFTVTERHAGNATTDFGAPDALLAADQAPFDQAAMERSHAILRACWQAFDRAAGHELRTGPRGGGRDLVKMTNHVLEADAAYLGSLGWKHKLASSETPDEALNRMRQATLQALQAAAEGALPTQGPRGGKRWPPRYFVRRVAWHVLDHAWEIEDRVL
jgi:hypothetical protein